ncbi:MAG: hypothetical protein WCL61_03980, partial [bacterium]
MKTKNWTEAMKEDGRSPFVNLTGLGNLLRQKQKQTEQKKNFRHMLSRVIGIIGVSAIIVILAIIAWAMTFDLAERLDRGTGIKSSNAQWEIAWDNYRAANPEVSRAKAIEAVKASLITKGAIKKGTEIPALECFPYYLK